MRTFSSMLVLLGMIAAQDATIHVEVRRESAPVADASVVLNRTTYKSDAQGVVEVSIQPGNVDIVVIKDGFVSVTTTITIVAGQRREVIVELQPTLQEEITVSATRTDKRLEDQPMRVEVLNREEIEEKMLMTPGDITMMLNEMGGMRVQATSPALGAASVRIQGMRGRYTRFLSDGLPLFGEQVGALGLLQIPPMDLGQVEVIKGVASSLYGAGAMGGVVNLISRKPGREPQREFLINRSTLGGTDAVVWYGAPLSPQWGLTMLAGGHWQRQTDVNDDAWADVPGYSRGVVRPRLSWDGGNGRTFFATTGITIENRDGGTRPDMALPANGAPYVEALDTRRIDAGAVGQTVFRARYVVSGRIALAQQRHDHQFGEVLEQDRHATAFGEVTVRASSGRNTWVAGVAVERDTYRPRDVPRFAYTFTTPGVFVQDDVDLARWLSISASGRLDRHSEYGVFFSPRLSALVRSGSWNGRLSLGTGFFGPSPLTEETEAAGLSRLTVPQPLRAERGRSMSFDHDPHRRAAVLYGDVFCVAGAGSDPCRTDRHRSDPDESRRANVNLWDRTADDAAAGPICRHRHLHVCAGPRARRNTPPGHSAHAAA